MFKKVNLYLIFLFVLDDIKSQQAGAVSVDEKIASTKYEIQKLTGVNDFGFWRLKMQVILVQQGLLEMLKGLRKMDVSLSEKGKMTMIEKSHIVIVLILSNKVLRQVLKEKATTDAWGKLEDLYMTKSLVNRLFLKQD